MIDLLKKHLASRDENEIISLITDHSEVLEILDENGSSGLMNIAYSGLNDAFAKAKEIKKTFSFIEAIVCGKKDMVNELVNDSIVNTHSQDGFTPLSLAAFFNQTEIAKLLVAKGGDPNIGAVNPTKVNVLHSAVARENYDLCKLLLAKGADVNSLQMQSVTPLHSAVHRGNLKLVKLLMEKGANITLEMDNGDTALSIAKREEHEDILTFFNNFPRST